MCVCIREEARGCRPDTVLPCSDTCLRFQFFFCFKTRPKPSDGGTESLSSGLCSSVPEDVRFNKLPPISCADVISVGGARRSMEQHRDGIRAACGNTQRLNYKNEPGGSAGLSGRRAVR